MYNLLRSQGKQLKELGLKARSDSRSRLHSAGTLPFVLPALKFPLKVILPGVIKYANYMCEKSWPLVLCLGLVGKWLACSSPTILKVGESLKESWG